MKINKNYIILSLIFFHIIISESVKAQDPQTLYYMNSVPQSTIMNPALQPSYNVFVGLPVISSLQVGAGNNKLGLTDIIMKHPTNDSLITFLHPDAEFNTSDFLSKLDDNNFLFEGKTNLKDFFKILYIEDTELFEINKGESETIAGFILEIYGKFPKKNEVVNFKNFKFKVESVDQKRIKKVKVTINRNV